MLHFLLSLAIAADIPTGARVVLPAAAPVLTPAGKPLLTTAHGTWGARVVQDRGEQLVVEPEANPCQRSLSMYPEVQLRVLVDEAALMPVTTRPVSGKGSAGEEWQVGAGVAVRDGKVDLGAVGPLTLPLPAEAVGRWTTEELLPSSFPDGDRWVGGPRGPVMFLGQPLSIMNHLNIYREKDRVYWKGACGGISFVLPANVPFSETDQQEAGIIGGLGTFPMVRVATGTTLRWPDGEEAGKTNQPTTFHNARQSGDQWCGDFTVEGQKQKLCTNEVEDILTEAPGTSPAAPAPIVLGALEKSAVDALIQANMKKVTQCYRRGLKEVPGNAGRLVLKWTITANGQVSNAVIKSSTLNNPTTEACILQVVQQMTFPKPDSGVVIVSYPFSFSP